MKNIVLCLAFLLVGTAVYAQTAGTNGRQPRAWDQAVSSVKLQSGGTDYTDNTTVLTNLALTGNQATGNASYISLTATDVNGVVYDYYLWVDATNAGTGGTKGTLVMASFPLIKQTALTSFPYGDWRATSGFTSFTKVSSQ